MSAPRSLARALLIATGLLLVADALAIALQPEGVGLALFGASLAVHGVLGAVWRLRSSGRLRSAGRRLAWPIAAAMYGALAFGAVVFGGEPVVVVTASVLNGTALVVAALGGLAEHRRSGERIHFVVRPALPA